MICTNVVIPDMLIQFFLSLFYVLEIFLIMSHIGKRRRTEEDEEPSNEVESNGLVQRQSSKIPAVLEDSIFGVQPTNDFIRVVGDFLYFYVGRENIEVN